MNENNPITKLIKGCNNCPFNVKSIDEGYAICEVDNPYDLKAIMMYGKSPITPDWCPLKIQPIIVKYE